MDELWFLMSERQVLKLHLIVARSPLFLALYDRIVRPTCTINPVIIKNLFMFHVTD